MVPYAAYLRVYEPNETLADAVARVAPSELTAAEQERSRRAAVRPGPVGLATADSGAAFELRRDGRTFVAPADELVRSWAALARLAGSLSPSAARALTPGAMLDDAAEALRAWQRLHPDAAPHVREATWRLPLVWLLLAVPDEREPYQLGNATTARYLTPMVQARRRVARAHAAARKRFPDSDDVVDLVDLGRWLESFHAHSWVELDLAGLGVAVSALDPAEPDRSLRAVQSAVEALREDRIEDAVRHHQDLSAWWGLLALREHAN